MPRQGPPSPMARHCLGTSMQSSDVGLGKCRGSESQARPPSSHLGADVSDLLDSGRPKVPGHLRAWAETCSSGGSLTRWVPGDPGRGARQGREALLPELCLGGPWTLLGLLTASQVARSVLEKKLLWSRPMRTAVRKEAPAWRTLGHSDSAAPRRSLGRTTEVRSRESRARATTGEASRRALPYPPTRQGASVPGSPGAPRSGVLGCSARYAHGAGGGKRRTAERAGGRGDLVLWWDGTSTALAF